MELNCETTTLSFSKGMTNIPSDMISEDGELMESVGFVYRNGEMVPIQKPVCITGDNPVEGKLVYCHKQADYRNLVTYIEDEKSGSYTLKLYPGFKSGNVADRLVQTVELGAKLLDVKSIGNTLVCATDKGLHYILYKGNSYKDLGTELPIPKVYFYFSAEEEKTELEKGRSECRIRTMVDDVKSDGYGYCCYDADGNFLGVKDSHDGAANYHLDYHHIMNRNNKDNYDNFQAAVKGHAAEAINYAKENNLFAFPFFLRTALRTFDGSTFARISNPIICYPSSQKNCKFGPCYYDSEKRTWVVKNNGIAPKRDASWQYMLMLNYSHLNFKVEIPNKDDWKDIIQELVVFASDQVIPFELDSDWDFKTVADLDGKVYYDGVREDYYIEKKVTFNWNTYHARELIEPVYKTERKIKNELIEKSQFFKLFSLKIDSEYIDDNWHDASAYDDTVSDIRIIAKDVLLNLKEQEQLKVDDYYGWTHLSTEKMFVYNGRLNAFGIKRKPFEGFSYFLATDRIQSDEEYVTYYVHIVSNGMDAWVKSEDTRFFCEEALAGWLYYPDPNAREMIIHIHGTDIDKKLHVNLYSHPMLNGVYSFSNLPSVEGSGNLGGKKLPTVDEKAYEYLDSQIFTSVVNNPFVFEASGDNTVGTGKIYGIVSNTEAVSTGQFGQYPLLVFTSEGIYGMSVNAEGLYSASYPISREVCNENSPFVPTGNMVFFTGMKGLMATSGGSVAFMSNKMSGYQPSELRTLDDGALSRFLRDCMIAYDYNESLLRIFANGKSYQYIYNTVDQIFAMDNSGIEAQAIVNDYPDNLIQDTEGNVYSLTDKPAAIDDENLYSGYLITRPLKFTGSMILKSLREINHLKKSADGKLSLEVWASNNAVNWCKLASRGGKPWAYFTFKYNLTDFKASDAFTGSLVRVQNRRSLMHNMEF